MESVTSSINRSSESPLDTLVRKTSTRGRSRNNPYADDHSPAQLSIPFTPPRAEVGGLDSPLLHTRFRSSTTTLNSSYHDAYDTSGSDTRSMLSYASPHDSYSAPYNSHAHGYSGGLHANVARERGQSQLSFTSMDVEDIAKHYRDTWRSTDTFQPPAGSDPAPGLGAPAVPTLVVTPESEWPDPAPGPIFVTPESPPRERRMPSRVQSSGQGVNFSRPHLPSINSAELEERKRQVLMRHQHPAASPATSRSPSASSMKSARSVHPSAAGSTRPTSPTSVHSARASPSQAAFARAQAPSPASLPLPPARGAPPAQRQVSTGSVYSEYSYYPPEAVVPPSPSSSMGRGSPLQAFPPPSPSATLSPTYVPSPRTPSTAPSATPASPAPKAPAGAPRTPQEFLQLGIQHHEANRLAESAACFEQSATLQGGCGVGMLMWGLAQRHGWGCAQSEKEGFGWLRRAAEMALRDLERAKPTEPGAVQGAVKSELVLAIYEVGQSFYRGWGVDKDKKMGVNYFRVAARMGDPDAQQELAFCLANAKGCKKDLREAAKWYRAAVAQGASDIGLAWIYKEKYQ